MSSLSESFQHLFNFRPELTGKVGVEREAFLRPLYGGGVVPESLRATQALLKDGRFPGCFGPELSACQIEFRTEPVEPIRLADQLWEREMYLREVLAGIGLRPDFKEVTEPTMSTAVYPDERYERIVKTIDPEVLLAACRVTGTHVHIGMPDLPTAIRVYDRVIRHTDELIALGDGSNGERIRLYRVVSPHSFPVRIGSPGELFRLAKEQGFVDNLRNWWSLIRITRYGTIEFRLFGNTESVETVVGWARRCHELCSAVW